MQNRTVSQRDAEVLLAYALEVDRTSLHTHPEKAVGESAMKKYEDFLRRRESNEPVAYIVGEKEFYGRMFSVDKRALIPRPETEGVVEQAVAWSAEYFTRHTTANGTPCPVRILELGTGCGNIAVSVALELARQSVPATVIATDISAEAIALAQENWKKLSVGHDTGNIVTKFVQADLFDHEIVIKRPFDLILANLPYVETTWQVETGAQPDVVFFEPDIALFGGSDGLDIYRRFFAEAPHHLEASGAVIIEYGETQTSLITPLVQTAFPDKKMTVLPDYAGLDRIITLV